MLKIRLIRTGKKNAPSYRVVLIEKNASPKSGKFLEILGNYNPRLPARKGRGLASGGKEISLKKDRIVYWLSKGAQASDTVHNLLVSQKVINKDKIKKKFSRRKVGIPTQEASGKIEEIKEIAKEEPKEVDKKEKTE